MAERTLKFLGTGTSVGVPVIGCGCPVCLSGAPENNRLRSSVVIRAGRFTLLVDSTPDLRAQALREKLFAIDGILYTHAHLDHVTGFDDLRAFCWDRAEPLPVYASTHTMGSLKSMFPWAFSASQNHRGYVRPDAREISAPFEIGGLRITPLPVDHGSVETHGFLFQGPEGRKLAYIPDAKRFPQHTVELLDQVDVLIIDALRLAPHPTHFSLDEALAAIAETRARTAYLTHLSHDHDHFALNASLPPHIRAACDGLEIAW